MPKNNLIAIVGFYDGSAGQVETWLKRTANCEIDCFVIDDDDFKPVDIAAENHNRVCQTTDFPQNGMLKGRPLVTTTNWCEVLAERGTNKVLCLDPVNQRRLAHIRQAREKGLELVSAIHPSAIILPDARIGEGVWINSGCVIGYKAEIHAGAILNTGVQVDHHNVLEACCQLDPGVVSAGNVTFRRCCHIHTHATVINRIEIGAHAVVGAGAVVIKDVPPNAKVAGVPARSI